MERRIKILVTESQFDLMCKYKYDLFEGLGISWDEAIPCYTETGDIKFFRLVMITDETQKQMVRMLKGFGIF